MLLWRAVLLSVGMDVNYEVLSRGCLTIYMYMYAHIYGYI